MLECERGRRRRTHLDFADAGGLGMYVAARSRRRECVVWWPPSSVTVMGRKRGREGEKVGVRCGYAVC
jgi:hypothetical protein